MSQEDISLDEKRIYGRKRRETVAYVAGDLGVTRVAISGDQVGRVGLAWQGSARDVAGGHGQLLVATAEDVLIGTDEGFDPTGFGPAAAVGVDEELLAAGPDGRIARLSGDEWVDVGDVEEPRAMDCDLVAAEEGVLRVNADGVEDLGGPTDGLRDVASAGPYAAGKTGCDRLGSEGSWIREFDGECDVVAAGRTEGGDRAHLVADGDLYERTEGEWLRCELPVAAPVADVAYGESPYAVTADGTVLIDADPEHTPDGDNGWRHRSLGTPGVVAIAVP